jgi:hypothetical protein
MRDQLLNLKWEECGHNPFQVILLEGLNKVMELGSLYECY